MIKDLPPKLKSLRIKYGYSQKQVSDKLGISPSIVSAYETGERTPSTEMLLSISYLYNCSTDYLLGKQSAEIHNSINVTGLSDRQLAALVSLVDALREDA